MIKLDDNLLAELGLHTLPPEEKKALLQHIYETLEMRVGTTLARQMTDAQLDEFEAFINNNDQDGALHWLETNFPNYKDVVAQEFEALKHEVGAAAPQILAGAQQAQAAMPPQQYAPQNHDPYAAQPQPGYQQPYPQQQPHPQQYGQHQGAPQGYPSQQPHHAQPQHHQPQHQPYPQQHSQQPYGQDQFDQAA